MVCWPACTRFCPLGGPPGGTGRNKHQCTTNASKVRPQHFLRASRAQGFLCTHKKEVGLSQAALAECNMEHRSMCQPRSDCIV